MDRPARNKKSINYSDFLDDDDDEDFATAKAPPNKKARASIKEYQQDKSSDSAAKACKQRVSLDDKLYKRDLEAALLLSQLRSTETSGEPHGNSREDEKSELREDVPPVLTHFSADGSCFDKPSSLPSEDSPPVLSNCSVDVSCLGLDQISTEQTQTNRKSQKATKQQRCASQDVKEKEEDEDYRPQNTPESDSEFSDLDESEDEEYTVKSKREKMKTVKREKKATPKAVTKDKKATKPAKSKPQSKVKNTALSRSPAAAQPLSALNRTPTTPPVKKSALQTSPAGVRVPKWTPPGLVGRSPGSCQSPPVKSPGLGLRLGLSRLARVKPLHPNAVAH